MHFDFEQAKTVGLPACGVALLGTASGICPGVCLGRASWGLRRVAPPECTSCCAPLLRGRWALPGGRARFPAARFASARVGGAWARRCRPGSRSGGPARRTGLRVVPRARLDHALRRRTSRRPPPLSGTTGRAGAACAQVVTGCPRTRPGAGHRCRCAGVVLDAPSIKVVLDVPEHRVFGGGRPWRRRPAPNTR